jgi:hypothetical protein
MRQQARPCTDQPQKEPPPVVDIKPGQSIPVAIQRLLDEIRQEGPCPPRLYNRVYNRHNRS